MMEFLVLSRDDIENNFECLKKHIVISIFAPEERCANIKQTDELLGTYYICTLDCDVEMDGDKYNNFLFNEHMAKDILNFVNYYKDLIEVVVCQCEAGISRSAGVAGALSKIFNGEDEYFFKHYLPNRLVYRIILEEAQKCGLL